MRGGGAAGSSEKTKGAPAQAVSAPTVPKPLAVPDRPSITVFADVDFFDEEPLDPSFQEGDEKTCSPLLPSSKSSSKGKKTPIGLSNNVNNKMKKAKKSPLGLKAGLVSVVEPSYKDPVRNTSNLVGSMDELTAMSIPAQITPVVPYGDPVRRRKIAEEVEQLLESHQRKEEEEATRTPTSVPASKQSNSGVGLNPQELNSSYFAREKVVKMGILRLKGRLKDLNLVVKRVQNDGNCQFRALSQQLFGTEECHDVVRYHVVSYMKRVRKEQYDCYFDSIEAADQYFQRLSQLGSWGDELTLRGASDSLFINIYVISSEESNFVIVYRPQPGAPPAPAFLVDVAKTRDAIRENLARKTRSMNPSMMPTPAASSLISPRITPARGSVASSSARPSMSNTPAVQAGGAFTSPTNFSGWPGGESSMARSLATCEDEDIGGVDASLLQQRLQSRLAKSQIQSAQPFFVRAGESAIALDHSIPNNSFAGLSGLPLDNSGPGGFGLRNDSFVMRGNRSMGKGGNFLKPSSELAQSFDPTIMASPHLTETRAKKSTSLLVRRPPAGTSSGLKTAKKKDSLPPQQARRFVAAGAELDPDPWSDGICVVRPEKDDVFIPTPAPERLLHPLMTAPSAEAPSSSQSKPGPASSMPTSCGFSEPAFPVFPHVDGQQIALVASRPAINNSLDQQASTSISFDLGASLNEDPSASPVMPLFEFEAHSKPIDVFLSYLYPVHYNALAPDDGHHDNDPNKWFSRVKKQGDAEEEPKSPRYISVPFLKPSGPPVNNSFAFPPRSSPTISANASMSTSANVPSRSVRAGRVSTAGNSKPENQNPASPASDFSLET